MIVVRQIVGNSMMPFLKPGQLVIGLKLGGVLKAGHVVIFKHNNKEKIKRIHVIDEEGRYWFKGDNENESTDSRHYGGLEPSVVVARVVWPRKLTK